MADQKLTTDEALAELASLGKRITELTSAFEGDRDPSAPVEPTAEAAAGGAPEAGLRTSSVAEGGAEPAHSARATQVLEASPRPAPREAVVGRPPRPGRAGVAGGGAAAPRATAASRPNLAFTPVPEPDHDQDAGGLAWLRRRWLAAPMFVSSVLHVVALLAMALMFLPRERPPERMAIVCEAAEDEPLEEITEVDLEPIETEAPVEPDTTPQPAEADLVAVDPGAAVSDQSATPMEQPVLGGDDLLGGGVSAGDLLASLGGGSGGRGGGGEGTGGGGGGGGTFFGRQGVGRTALFMCDNSNSYAAGGFQAVLIELSRAVSLMKPEQSFHVVFFSDTAYKLLHPEGVDTFLAATPENKRKLDAWLPTVELCAGGRGIRGASELAIALKPDVIYFLSDGDHGDGVVDRMVELPLDGTVVHTFGMQADVRDRRTGRPDPDRVQEQQRCTKNLVRIAEAHGGTFTPVVISPQAAMAASARPVKKNRTRGTVWGVAIDEDRR